MSLNFYYEKSSLFSFVYLVAMIFTTNSYSQEVGGPQLYLDNDDEDSNDNAISNSFLHVTREINI